LYEPTENLDILLTGEIFRRDGVGRVQGFLNFDGNPNPEYAISDPQNFSLDTQAFRDQDDDSLRWEFKYEFDFADLVYIGSSREHDRVLWQDLDGTSLVDSVVGEVFNSDYTSHELRLTSNGGGSFDWLIGYFTFEEQIDSVFHIEIPTTTGLTGVPTVPFTRLDFDFDVPNQENSGFGVFANGEWRLSDSLRLSAGIRSSIV
jgi:hypothetical protein